MKNKLILILALCVSVQSTVSLDASQDPKIQNQINMILEWAKNEPDEKLSREIDTHKFLNPQQGDTLEQIEAKKIGKQLIKEKRLKQSITPEPEQSYWRMYAPQAMQDLGDYAASWVPKSVKNKINSLSRKQQIGLLSTLIAVLAAIYNKDAIIAFVNNAFERSTFINEAKAQLDSWTEDKTIDPISQYHLKKILANGDNKELERLLGEIFDSKDMSSNQDRFKFLFDIFRLRKLPHNTE